MAVDVIFERTKTTIGVIQLDAALRETHRKSMVVTEHPVEEGANIADHIRSEPETIIIDGVISDTPIVYLGEWGLPESPITTDPKPGDPDPSLTDVIYTKWKEIVEDSKATSRRRILDDRARRAYEKLVQIADSGEIVDVVSNLREYTNMAIVDMTTPQEAATANIIRISITLRNIRTVTLQTVAAPEPVTTPKRKKRDQGKKSKSEASKKQDGDWFTNIVNRRFGAT